MNKPTRYSNVLSALALVGALLTAGSAFGDPADFNGDGFADLAVGAPANNTGGKRAAGLVSIVFGSAAGPNALLTQSWHQDTPGVPGIGEAGDGFGQSLTHGDFDGDGYSDLAIGAPGEGIGERNNAGAVWILYGGPNGPTTNKIQSWNQDSTSMLGLAESGDFFGFSLTAGDFDRDGYSDLAVGVPFEGGSASTKRSGAVQILYGGRNGLSAARDQLWSQGTAGMPGTKEADDFLGYSLAVGDFDDDGFDDLAAGIPMEDVGSRRNAGAVTVLYGTTTGLRTTGAQIWTQDSPGVRGASEPGDWLGFGLAAGDFDDDGRDDLAIGVPLEDLGSTVDAGGTIVLYGASNGLVSNNHSFLSQDTAGFPDTDEPDDCQGSSFAAGDFDGDGVDDLAIGTPHENIYGTDAGLVTVAYGASRSTPFHRSQIWHQRRPGVADGNESFDQFGLSLSAGDLDGDGFVDLFVGVPAESLNGRAGAGALHILYGTADGVTGTGSDFIDQSSVGIDDPVATDDWFAFGVH